MNRREAIKRGTLTVVGTRLAYLAAVSGAALETGGCNIFNDILNWVPVGKASVNSILAVLTSNGIAVSPAASAAVALIEAGFTALTAAVKEYQATSPAPVGAVAKVQLALKAVVDNFQTFLASLNVPGSIFSVISGLAQIVLSTIVAFQNELPATPTSTAAVSRTAVVGDTAHVGPNLITITPKKRTIRAYKKEWNAVLDAGVKVGVTAPKSAYHHLSLFERL
jgi:hypothetical protein